jgi:HAD superfamily hydrolase (TIGR01509 family)
MMDAVVFDMDGVIVDSELQWMLCSRDFFRRILPQWKEEDNREIVGLAVEDLHQWLVEEYSLTQSKADFLKECHEIADVVYKDRTSLTPGIMELLDDLRRSGIPLGLASSSPKAWVDMTLERFSLSSRFAARASADDVSPGRTKPHPDLYQLVIKKLSVRPHFSLAVEDSCRGVRAAKAARLTCAALRNGANDQQDLSEADFELSGLAGVTAARLDALRCEKRTSPKI